MIKELTKEDYKKIENLLTGTIQTFQTSYIADNDAVDEYIGKLWTIRHKVKHKIDQL